MSISAKGWATTPGAAMLAAMLALSACAESTAPLGSPVELRAAAGKAAATSSVGVVRTASPAQTQLEVTSLRLTVGNAGLGHGDQFGCIDCEGGNESESRTPREIDIPINGGSVLLETEMASPGVYSEIELELGRGAEGAAAGPAQTTVQIGGRYAGEAFTMSLAVEGSSRHPLDPPVEVTQQASTSTSATLQFPVEAWFTGSGGRLLDPGNPTDRSVIETNIRSYFTDRGDPE